MGIVRGAAKKNTFLNAPTTKREYLFAYLFLPFREHSNQFSLHCLTLSQWIRVSPPPLLSMNLFFFWMAPQILLN